MLLLLTASRQSKKVFKHGTHKTDHPGKISKDDVLWKVIAFELKLHQLSAKQVRITMNWNVPARKSHTFDKKNKNKITFKNNNITFISFTSKIPI